MSAGEGDFYVFMFKFLPRKTKKERRNHNVIRIAFLREPSYPVGGTINWCSHCGKMVWRFLRKLKTITI